MNEGLAKREAAELAAIPEWMREDAEATALNMDFRQEDLIMPRVAICQSGTPQRKRTSDNYVAGLEEGDLFNTLTGTIYAKVGESLKFVVLANWNEQIFFGDGGKVNCRSREGVGCQLNGGRECCNSGWREDGKTMKEKKPLCTEFLNFIAFLPEHNEFAILSFKSEGLKAARQSIIAKLRVGQRGIADFAKVFVLTTKHETYDVGEAHQPVIRRGEMKAGAESVGEVLQDQAVYAMLKKKIVEIRGRKTQVKVDESGQAGSAPGNVEVIEGDAIPF